MTAEPIRDDHRQLGFEARLLAHVGPATGADPSMTPVVICPSCRTPLDLDSLVERVVALRSRVAGAVDTVEITPREQAVLDALLQGYRTHQIALFLGISTHTVRKHLRSLYGKADCASQADLVSWARARRVRA
ncbi:MAG TPA: helix-turn-helix transcriptional regulator [Acidimicrobiia bacterium]|nr:helix-turn-helix transcriptional regulator [Acidimicrobiia bacterium]